MNLVPRVIHRDEIPTLRSVVVDGVEHSLGVLKNFRAHPAVAAFIPEDARLALSWVRLEVGERLDIHVHTIDSMIVMAHGQGRVLGGLEAPFSDGDIILIPRGCRHGFEGAGTNGFWALSTQFENRGLYERPDQPLVEFERADGLSELMALNLRFCDEHRNNPIFSFVTSEAIENPACRQRFLRCVHLWSSYYQKAVMARTVFTEDPRYVSVFRRHLDEEYGHDSQLAADLALEGSTLWDPVLDASANWFAWRMVSLDNLEKVVLIHLVLERAGSIFHELAASVMARFGETDYFARHMADDEHANMATAMLRGHGSATYSRLMEVQRRGWNMLNALCTRMVAVANGAGQ